MFWGIAFAHQLVVVSVLVSFAGAAVYVRDMIRGRTKPNRVSWFLWGIVPVISAVASLSVGADPWATVRVLVAGLVPLLIFFISFFNPQGYWKLTRFDYACGAFSVIALALWGFADSPRVAILLLATADGFAALPTILKAWQFPETETGWPFIAGLVAVLLVLPSIPVWNVENSAFQIYLIVANIALVFSVYRKRLFALK